MAEQRAAGRDQWLSLCGIHVHEKDRPYLGARPVKRAAKPKPKPKPKLTDKAQSERFIEAARKLDIEETGETFEKAFKTIIKSTIDRAT